MKQFCKTRQKLCVLILFTGFLSIFRFETQNKNSFLYELGVVSYELIDMKNKANKNYLKNVFTSTCKMHERTMFEV